MQDDWSFDDGVAHYRAELARVVQGKRWVVATDHLSASARLASELASLGADRVMCVAGSGSPGPTWDTRFDVAVLGVTAPDMMGAIRKAERSLSDLPPAVRAQVDAFDPGGSARAVRTLFSDDSPVADRPCWGGRPADWLALEDKTTVDALWDAAGVARAPFAVVPASEAALIAAHQALDAGAGVVWAADNRHGWHGGATGLRWVRTQEDCTAAVAHFAESSHRVRLMPFLEGIPCSIHGIVVPNPALPDTPHTVLALRPCEMIVLRQPGSDRFRYSRAATFWDPPAADREAMREVARRVGRHLSATVGYRGVFTVDGIMTRDGFRPTELNPRFGAAIGVMTQPVAQLPLYLLHLAMVADEPLDWRPASLERLLVRAADDRRAGRGMALLTREITDTSEHALVLDRGAWREAGPDEPPHARARLTQAATGGFLDVVLDADATPVGPPAGPRVAAILRHLDAALDLGIGRVEAARDVRGSV